MAQYAVQGKIYVRFLGLQPVQKADAEHITATITCTGLGMEEEMWKKRLVGIYITPHFKPQLKLVI